MAYQIKQPSDATLKRTLTRAWKFLGALANQHEITNIMRGKGFTEAEQEKGWELVQIASGYRRRPVSTPSPNRPLEEAIRKAIAELDNWDEPNFGIFHATLMGDHPAVHQVFFGDGLEPKKGIEAVGSVKILLDRFDKVKYDPDNERPDTRQEDLAAIAALEALGYHDTERQRLRALIETAMTALPADPTPPTPPIDLEAQQKEALLKVYYWYKKWAAVARAHIERRDYLQNLGLLKRKKRKNNGPKGGGGGDEDDEEIDLDDEDDEDDE